MKKFFSFMKELVSSPEGSEEAEALDCQPSGDDACEIVMTIASQGEDGSDVGTTDATPESNKMEQMEPEESPSGAECHEQVTSPKELMPGVAMSTDSDEAVECEAANGVGDPAADQVEVVSSASQDGCCSSGGGTGGGTGGTVSTAAVAATEDLRTNSSETDTSSWEPKTKDVKMALTEKGDNNAIGKETERTASKLSKPEVIHPLQNSWGIWCFMQNRCQDWHENVRHISNFSSVEDFWSLFNHIQTVDNLPIGCDYYIFKANIQPMWEDKANVNGGRWLLKIPQSHPNFVQLWIETLLLIVGEAFESETDSMSICGAVAQVRRGFNKISIWTREAGDRSACMRIGYRWKNCIKVAAPIHYEAHLEANRKGGRRSKSVYSIN